MNTRRGFTLLELSIVLMTIGVLAAMLLPSLARTREAARRNSCMANLSQLGIALRMYAAENDRALPWSGGRGNADCLLDFRHRYAPEVSTFICPSDANAERRTYYEDADGLEDDDHRIRVERMNTEIDGETSLRTSYDYIGAYTPEPVLLPHPSRPEPPRFPVMWDVMSGNWDEAVVGKGIEHEFEVVNIMNHIPGGGNVLWLDGSVTFELNREWYGPNLPAQPPGFPMARWSTVPPKVEDDDDRPEWQEHPAPPAPKAVAAKKRAG
ncbi:MAG: DUF1559 domain-containing protein [Candidatus Hydrogenedens sp.]|nr:DUF1559 domain-containing protein [Candidatus Hydrogenedens sp.]